MYNIFLSPFVSITLFLSFLLLTALSIAAFNALQILKRYTPNAVTPTQYALQKRSYLITTLIQISLIIYIAVLVLFIYTLNDLATLIPGAMCAAGVITANSYGNPLLLLKITIILLSLLWLSLNRQDYQTKGHPYFHKKLYLFLFIYLLLLWDVFLEVNFFTHLSTLEPVLCCSNIYARTAVKLPFSLPIDIFVALFYITFVLLLLVLHYKKRVYITAFSLLFLYLSYLTVTYFFSPYIYELPTHTCPYCILEKEYDFIGYFFYGTLLFATFYALNAALLGFDQKSYLKACYAYSIFVLLVSAKVIYYVFINHTLL